MKIKNLFIALFAASALFACNDDESVVPDNNQGTKSISVSLAGMSGVKNQGYRSRKLPYQRYDERKQCAYQPDRCQRSRC